VAEFPKRHRGVEIEGIDFAQTAVAKTRARGIPATIQDLDVEPNLPSAFDYIMFIEVLEHLRFPHRVLRTAAGFAGIGQRNCWTEPWSQRVVDRSGFVNSEAPGRYVFIAITSFRVSV